MSREAQEARERSMPAAKVDKLPESFDPNIDPARFQGAALATGVAARGTTKPVLESVTGPQPVRDIPRGAPILEQTSSTDEVLRFGSRKLDVPGLGTSKFGRPPDEVLEQRQGGKVIRSILCEVTLDSKLQQEHKRSGLQIPDTIARADTMYQQHPDRSPDFELVYLILAKGNPGDMDSETRDFIVGQLRAVARNVPKTKVRVIWQWIPIV
jgi:hypothetical protein